MTDESATGSAPAEEGPESAASEGTWQERMVEAYLAFVDAWLTLGEVAHDGEEEVKLLGYTRMTDWLRQHGMLTGPVGAARLARKQTSEAEWETARLFMLPPTLLNMYRKRVPLEEREDRLPELVQACSPVPGVTPHPDVMGYFQNLDEEFPGKERLRPVTLVDREAGLIQTRMGVTAIQEALQAGRRVIPGWPLGEEADES